MDDIVESLVRASNRIARSKPTARVVPIASTWKTFNSFWLREIQLELAESEVV